MSVSSSSPEDRAVAGIKAAVQGAKSFYQNGEEAASFFGNWIGPACGVPDFDFDIFAVFGSLVGAPDSMSLGAPVGCKKKTGCRDVDPVPDPPNKPDIPTNKPTDEPPAPAITDEPKITAEPTATGNPTTTTVTTTSTAGAACAYCGGFNKKQVARDGKYQAMYARAGNSNNGPVCVMPPRKDILSKRDVSDLIRNRLSSRSFLLQERALTEKNSKIRTELGKEGQINPYMWECSVGKYAPSSDAANIAEIIKYWTFKKPQDQKKCSVEVEKVATGTISDFETDHVFEAQTFANFIKWLANEEPAMIGTTYKKPSALWAEQTILGDGPNSFRIISPDNTNAGDLFTPSTGEIPVVLMAYGFGRSDGVKSISDQKGVERISTARGNQNLVLLHKNINGAKGIYFRKAKINIDKTSQLDFRLGVRRGVGPFQYLAASDGTTDTMWKKWARVSNWIDLVCHEFDKQYKWDPSALNGEPTNSAAVPSLRSLWAFFIDQELSDIEAIAASWANDANKEFDKKWKTGGLSKDEKAWRKKAFGANGFATPAKMKFPRPARLPACASIYGAYGWNSVTFDASNQDPGIGSPIKIT